MCDSIKMWREEKEKGCCVSLVVVMFLMVACGYWVLGLCGYREGVFL